MVTACDFCGGPIPEWRAGTEYCSARCWAKHHGETPDEHDEPRRQHEEESE